MDELGQTFVVGLISIVCVSSIKTDTRRILRLDELFFEIRFERRTTKGGSSGRIMRLYMPVFIQETHNQTNYKCLPKFVQTDQCVLSIKTASELEKVHSLLF